MIARRAFLLLAAAALPGCSSRPATPVESAGTDQEITVRIRLRFREDPRLEGIIVVCKDRIVTLTGRVPDLKAAQEAARIAAAAGPGVRVISGIEIRPR